MRLLTAISLALIVLMALACTATPTPTPTPTEPTSSGGVSCQELTDKLVSAQTETAAGILTSIWNESECTKKVAGEQLYKDVPVTVEVTRVVPVTVPVTAPVTRVVVKEVPVTRVVSDTTIIMVTPELARSSSLAGTTWRFLRTVEALNPTLPAPLLWLFKAINSTIDFARNLVQFFNRVLGVTPPHERTTGR